MCLRLGQAFYLTNLLLPSLGRYLLQLLLLLLLLPLPLLLLSLPPALLLLLCSLSAGLPASFYRCPCNFHVLTLPTLHSLSPL